jgi:pimeloyl-ACP methyl ester carboxylesterase
VPPSQLSYREAGRGEPLLLINGYAAGKLDWDPGFLDALAGRSRVICPDNRGIGESPPVSGVTDVAAMAADALALMDALGLESANVGGWSMGGFIAQELVACAPERVRRLVLLSTDGGGPDAVTATPEVWARLTDHGGSPREQASRLLALLFPPAVAATVDAEFGDVVAEARAGLSHHTLSAQEAAIAAWHAEPQDGARLRRVTAPVLVAAGTEDVVIPFANVEILATALTGSRSQGFPGGGHAFMAQEPDRVARLINGFLGG